LNLSERAHLGAIEASRIAAEAAESSLDEQSSGDEGKDETAGENSAAPKDARDNEKMKLKAVSAIEKARKNRRLVTRRPSPWDVPTAGRWGRASPAWTRELPQIGAVQRRLRGLGSMVSSTEMAPPPESIVLRGRLARAGHSLPPCLPFSALPLRRIRPLRLRT